MTKIATKAAIGFGVAWLGLEAIGVVALAANGQVVLPVETPVISLIESVPGVLALTYGLRRRKKENKANPA